MSEWQPIEAAPKDGTSILVAGGTMSSDSGWGDKYPLTGVTIAWWYSRSTDGWCLGNAEAHDEYLWAQPTHWMPLPLPPTNSTPTKEN